jgi:hypothetical protein
VNAGVEVDVGLEVVVPVVTSHLDIRLNLALGAFKGRGVRLFNLDPRIFVLVLDGVVSSLGVEAHLVEDHHVSGPGADHVSHTLEKVGFTLVA